jgi:hypothetical protein
MPRKDPLGTVKKRLKDTPFSSRWVNDARLSRHQVLRARRDFRDFGLSVRVSEITNVENILATNRGLGSWGEVLGDSTVATAMLDRLLHRSDVITLNGDSYRLRDDHAHADQLRCAITGIRPLR